MGDFGKEYEKVPKPQHQQITQMQLCKLVQLQLTLPNIYKNSCFFVDCEKGSIDEFNEKRNNLIRQTIFLVWETLLSSRVLQSRAEVRA